jgi:hypothetical protein
MIIMRSLGKCLRKSTLPKSLSCMVCCSGTC